MILRKGGKGNAPFLSHTPGIGRAVSPTIGVALVMSKYCTSTSKPKASPSGVQCARVHRMPKSSERFFHSFSHFFVYGNSE